MVRQLRQTVAAKRLTGPERQIDVAGAREDDVAEHDVVRQPRHRGHRYLTCEHHTGAVGEFDRIVQERMASRPGRLRRNLQPVALPLERVRRQVVDQPAVREDRRPVHPCPVDVAFGELVQAQPFVAGFGRVGLLVATGTRPHRGSVVTAGQQLQPCAQLVHGRSDHDTTPPEHRAPGQRACDVEGEWARCSR